MKPPEQWQRELAGETSVEAIRAIQQDALMAHPATWRCFHCDEIFTDREKAQEHFGASVECKPLCQIYGTTVRNMEKELAAYRNENSELHRQIAHLQCEHTQALMRAEEAGYAKGLADGRKLNAMEAPRA